MVRNIRVVLAALLLVPLLGSAGAAEEAWRLTSGGWVSGDVEYVGTIAREAGTAVSATLHRQRLYVTTFRSFSIYDVSDPLAPQPLSTTPLGLQLYNEQPETNGEILLLASDTKSLDAGVDPLRLRWASALDVWDVGDPLNPRQLASLPLPRREHIWTCVLDCKYAYGAAGAIVDLTRPAQPVLVGDWATQLGGGAQPEPHHTIEEVAPGLVLTGGTSVRYLDARQDPTRPRLLASVRPTLTNPGFPSNPTSLPAHVGWPGAPTSLDEEGGRFLLMSMETPLGGTCDNSAGGFRTYDTEGWSSSGTFRFVDEYVFSDNTGTYTNGRAAHHVWGCSAYVYDAHPRFAETGQVAVAWFEDGVRLLRVDDEGEIDEIGGFLPLGGVAATPLWRNDEVLYSVDMHRGVDILRVQPAEASD